MHVRRIISITGKGAGALKLSNKPTHVLSCVSSGDSVPYIVNKHLRARNYCMKLQNHYCYSLMVKKNNIRIVLTITGSCLMKTSFTSKVDKHFMCFRSAHGGSNRLKYAPPQNCFAFVLH